MKTTYKKYNNNLTRVGNKIYSYNTNVARIDGKKLIVLPWRIKRTWNNQTQFITSSPTTSKHINFIAEELGLTIQK